eukprot:COSAG02_NODE_71_length_42019_cov_36.443893_17_plen_247_part_00
MREVEPAPQGGRELGGCLGGWEALTPRGEWRTMSSRTDRASEVLGRIMNTHEAAMRQPFGPKQYQPGTSSDEEADEGEDDEGESVMVVMSEDPRTPESLIKISRSSSYHVLSLPTYPPSAPNEEDVRPTEEEELAELARENERLKAAIAIALHEEKERSARRSDRAAFKRMERIYASAGLEPEPQLPAQAAAAHTALAHQNSLEDDPDGASPAPQLLSMMKERERVMQQQKEEIEKLRQQLAMHLD